MKKNKKGFTLVELLAVIVVLAIIMIIAVPSVMESMNNARKQSFVIYGQKVLTTVSTKYESKLLLGTTFTLNAKSEGATANDSVCYTLKALMGQSVGNYDGYVLIKSPNSDNTKYILYLKDNNYSIKNVEFSGIKIDEVGNSSAITIPDGCNTTF